jgi:hypothetical protein
VTSTHLCACTHFHTPVHPGAGRVKRENDEFRQVFRPVMFKASCFALLYKSEAAL